MSNSSVFSSFPPAGGPHLSRSLAGLLAILGWNRDLGSSKRTNNPYTDQSRGVSLQRRMNGLSYGERQICFLLTLVAHANLRYARRIFPLPPAKRVKGCVET